MMFKHLKLNSFTPDEMAVIRECINLRGVPCGDLFFAVPTSPRDAAQALNMRKWIARECECAGIRMRCEMIASHKVDKRHHRKVKFSTKKAVKLPNVVVFIFPTQDDQFWFMMNFG
jgi:hypothetical protein